MIGATWKVGAVSRTHHPQHTLAGLAATCPPFAGACRLLSLLASLLPLAGSKKGCKTMLGVRGERETGRNDNLFLYIFSSFPNWLPVVLTKHHLQQKSNPRRARSDLDQTSTFRIGGTDCLLVGCKVLEKDSWNNCSKCECSISWARSAALSVLLGLSEKQKQRRFLSIFVIKKNVLVKMVSGFMNLLCLVVLVGYRVAHGAVCKKLDFF